MVLDLVMKYIRSKVSLFFYFILLDCHPVIIMLWKELYGLTHWLILSIFTLTHGKKKCQYWMDSYSQRHHSKYSWNILYDNRLQNWWFQQDSAQPHFTIVVIDNMFQKQGKARMSYRIKTYQYFDKIYL